MSFASVCFWAMRSLRSELELVDEGLNRLMICEIGKPVGAFSALKFRMIAMPSCAYESLRPRAVSVITATSFMNCSELKNSNSDLNSPVCLFTTSNVKMPQFGWQLHDDQPQGASAPCNMSITLVNAEYDESGNQSRSGSILPRSWSLRS